jgi:hypothetical protein
LQISDISAGDTRTSDLAWVGSSPSNVLGNNPFPNEQSSATTSDDLRMAELRIRQRVLDGTDPPARRTKYKPRVRRGGVASSFSDAHVAMERLSIGDEMRECKLPIDRIGFFPFIASGCEGTQEVHRCQLEFLMRISPMRLAEQIAFFNNRAFRSIACREWLAQKWGYNQRRSHSSDQIRLMAELFGAISMWVQNSIILRSSIEARAAAIEYFAQICTHLLSLADFQGAIAVCAGLDPFVSEQSHLRFNQECELIEPSVFPLRSFLDAPQTANQSIKCKCCIRH